jgi:hypothetical protein
MENALLILCFLFPFAKNKKPLAKLQDLDQQTSIISIFVKTKIYLQQNLSLFLTYQKKKKLSLNQWIPGWPNAT